MAAAFAYGCTPRHAEPNEGDKSSPGGRVEATKTPPSAEHRPVASAAPTADDSLDTPPAESARPAPAPVEKATRSTASARAPGAGEGPRPIEREDLMAELQKSFRAFVAERQACQTSEECIFVGTRCPFGCRVIVNGAHAEAVKAKHDELYGEIQAAGMNCTYKCIPAGEPKCSKGRCEVVPTTPSPSN